MNNGMDFKQFFKQELSSQPPEGMVMKYNIHRTENNIKHIVFVEGSSDKLFYSKTSYTELSQDVEYIFQSYSEGNGGKESVFYAYHKITSDKSLISDIGKCLFIVDKDWDTSLRSENDWIKKKDEQFIMVTKGHSMECYFMDYDNAEIILKRLGYEKYISDFNEKFQLFAAKTVAYWALKGVMAYAFKKKLNIRYKKKYSFSDVFAYDFSKDMFFNEEYMNEEIKVMELSISGNENLERYYGIWCQKIQDNYMYIRGHEIFNFLHSYIEYISGKKISERDLFEQVPYLKIDLDVKSNMK